MTCIRAKEILKIRGKSGIKIPDDDILSELFLEAMLYIASKCVPSKLIRHKREFSSNTKVFRCIEGDKFICVPDKPDFSNEKEHIMIDESLTYAVVNEVLFLINKDELYKKRANEIIALYNANDGCELYER